MSELLRGVLDATCLDSRPAWYTGRIDTTVPNTGAITLAPRQTTIECKTDTWFLMMGYWWFAQEDAGVVTGTYLPTLPAGITIQRGGDSWPFSNAPTPQYLSNATLNNARTLSEYILWQPAATMVLTYDVPVTGIAVGAWYTFLVLAGIEYKMPPGKGFADGRRSF